MHVRALAAIVAVATAVAISGCGMRGPWHHSSLPIGGERVRLNPHHFSTTIDNPYWPMEPGTRWTYREIDTDGTEYTVVVTVTSKTREIANGVEARVVRDTVSLGDEVVEDTFDWYAQDSKGAIWYLGEQTAEFEDGEMTSTEGSFEAGVDGAQPGIIMPGHPTPGMKYRQEYLKGEAEDNGEIVSLREMAEVPYGFFDHVLLTRETISIEPKALEYKFYAKGVGLVLTLDISGGSAREELLSVTQVPPGTGLGPLGEPD